MYTLKCIIYIYIFVIIGTVDDAIDGDDTVIDAVAV